jgi:hypothetical protein
VKKKKADQHRIGGKCRHGPRRNGLRLAWRDRDESIAGSHITQQATARPSEDLEPDHDGRRGQRRADDESLPPRGSPWELDVTSIPGHRARTQPETPICERIPGVTLRTTFIVGFPGESEDDFAQLLDFVAESRFDRVGIFRYSDEEGTAAAALDGKVSRAVARERYQRLAKLSAAIQAEKLRALVGSEASVLVDAAIGKDRTRGRLASQDGVVFLHGAARVGDLLRANHGGKGRGRSRGGGRGRTALSARRRVAENGLSRGTRSALPRAGGKPCTPRRRAHSTEVSIDAERGLASIGAREQEAQHDAERQDESET